MGYLIKDLSKLTGVKGFTIRKWQERYRIFQPQLAPNGYWYYTPDDFTILSRIVKRIEQGEKISSIVALGREKLLSLKDDSGYTEEEKKLIRLIQENQFTEIGNLLEKYFSESTRFSNFIYNHIERIAILVGRAWKDGLISVADEYSFSRWMIGYLRQKCNQFEISGNKPIWLVAVFPGDTHELGALMHYAILLSKKIPARFVGNLPVEHLIKELNRGQYRALSVSLTLAPSMGKIEKFKNTILSKTRVKKVFFGGRGYKLAKYGIAREK